MNYLGPVNQFVMPPSLSQLGRRDQWVEDKITFDNERSARLADLNKKILKVSEELIWKDYAQSTRVKKRLKLQRLLLQWKSEH